jgi:hypothetical protein
VGLPLLHRREDLIPKPVGVAEGEILFGAEVGEERLDRNVGGVGDLGHGDVLVTAGLEERFRHRQQGVARLALLSLSQTLALCHFSHMVTVPENESDLRNFEAEGGPTPPPVGGGVLRRIHPGSRPRADSTFGLPCDG